MPPYDTYTQDYKDKCRSLWYANGRPDPTSFRKMLIEQGVVDERGRVPHFRMIKNWRDDDAWGAWADVLDAQAMVLVEDDLIQRKAVMLQEQAQRGFDLQVEGMKYIKEEGFDSSSAAVQAVVRGAELERTSRGIGEMILKMSKMSDVDLKAEIIKGMKQMSEAGQIIDVEPVPEEKVENEEI